MILAADQILVLLVKQGKHAELIALGPTCLRETQFGQEREPKDPVVRRWPAPCEPPHLCPTICIVV